MVGYTIAKPNEYLVVTGFGIATMKLCKKAFIKPGQQFCRFSMTPENYTFSLQAMSQEKLEFTLPAVFTIGPHDDQKSLLKFAQLLVTSTKSRETTKNNHLDEIVKGIVEGEMRVIAAGLTIEEIFQDRKSVKDSIIHSVQSELDQFGLFIYNANIKQLQDAPGSEYFQYLRMKTHEGAINQAKVDVADARYKGDVGEAERKGKTRQENSRIESATIVLENQRKAEIANAQTNLTLETTQYDLKVRLAKLEAEKTSEAREADLQRTVEIKRAQAAQEKLRASSLAKTKVDAEGIIALADAELYKRQREADAILYAQERAAAGISAQYQAQAAGIKAVSEAFSGDTSAVIQYIMIERGIYQDLARANGEAIRGLAPKLNVWNTGGGDGSSTDPLKPIREMQSLIPLITNINDMTGVRPPAWVANVPANTPDTSS